MPNLNFDPVCFVPPRDKLRYVNHNDMEITEEAAFFKRMSTYVGSNWTLKPRQVGPPVCVMYGWQAIKEDVLKCVSCNKVLSGRLPPTWKSEHYEKAVNDLKCSIQKDAHDEFCPWPLNPSPDNFLYIRLTVGREAIDDLTTRATSLIQIVDALPSISQDVPVQLRADSVNLISTRQFLQLPEELSYEALILAMTGWTSYIGKFNMKKLKCENCFRLASVSFFITSPTKPSTATATKLQELEPQSLDESFVSNGVGLSSRSSCSSVENGDPDCPPSKKQKYYNHDIKAFHPLKEHQNWCPWVDLSYTVPNNSTEKYDSGWKKLSTIFDTRLKKISTSMDMVGLRERVLKVISTVKSC